MSWQPELDELKRRQELVKRMGGPDKVKRQHDGGRLTVRERIDRLLDPGSFREWGSAAGMATYDRKNDLEDLVASNSVTGRGTIDGRPVVVSGDDFTVRGGSADATIKEKNLLAEKMANQYRLPIVRIIEGSGGGGSVKTIETQGRANVPGVIGFDVVTANMGAVPVVALGLGSVAGLGAARLAASHYSVMVKGLSAMFVAGPPVVARLGQPLSKEELGGWEIQLRAGAVDEAVDTEDEAFAAAKRFLSYMPQSAFHLAPRGPVTDEPNRRDEKLLSVIPRDTRKVYNMRSIIQSVIDKGSFFEMNKMYGRSVITGLCRIDGWPIAFMASDPMHYGGAWTTDTCLKVTRFMDIAETFRIPIVYLEDCPGFLIGLEAEKSGVIKAGVRAMAAMHQCTVPWCTFIVRNNFGVAGAAHKNTGRVAIRYAWPSGRWGSLPLEGGIEAAYRADIEASPNPKAKLAEIEERLNKLRSPFRSAESFWIEEIVDPRDTRRLLCEFANLAAPVREGKAQFWMRP